MYDLNEDNMEDRSTPPFPASSRTPQDVYNHDANANNTVRPSDSVRQESSGNYMESPNTGKEARISVGSE